MPRWLSCLAGLVVWLNVLAAGQASELCPEPSKGFGGVPRGTVLTHQFRLTNPGPQSLHVSEVRTSCDCATAAVTQQEIPPGGSVPVTVTIRTAMYAGYRSFTVFVAIDRPVKQEEQLKVSATSLEDVMVDPGTLNVGRLRAGQSGQASARIDYRGVADGWRLTTVDQTSPHFSARFEELKRERGLVQYRLHVQWKGTAPPGPWRLPVYLRTNDPYFPRLTVPVEAEVLPTLTVTPPVLYLEADSTGTAIERKITVRGPKPFRVLRAEASDPCCTVHGLTTEAKTVHVLTVRLAPPGVKADASLLLILHTDLPEQPRTECQVRVQK